MPNKKAQTKPPFTKCPFVLAYRQQLRRASETLERYANMVGCTRALGLQQELADCLRESAGSNRVAEGSLLDPAVFMHPRFLRSGLPAGLPPRQGDVASYVVPGRGIL
eukprot:g3420.t1